MIFVKGGQWVLMDMNTPGFEIENCAVHFADIPREGVLHIAREYANTTFKSFRDGKAGIPSLPERRHANKVLIYFYFKYT